MSKILFVADIHLKLGVKKIPNEWAYNRFMQLASKLNALALEQECDSIMIGGDLLDTAKPKPEEVALMYDFLKDLGFNQVNIILFPGNHELLSKKRDCYVAFDRMLQDLNVTIIRDHYRSEEYDIIPFNVLHDAEWPDCESGILFTHVRGAIAPHVEPEIDLSKFAFWEKVFAGDLHSYKNSQGNLFYPGSPISTSFHRNVPKDTNGVFIIDTFTTEFTWHEFELPHLIRKTVTTQEEMVQTHPHHTIYEITGDMETLSNIKDSELFDKKLNKNVSTEATLKMSGKISEEVAEYLTKVEGLKPETTTRVVSKLKEIVPDDNH